MIELIQHITDWVGSHPHWSGVIIALVAFSESLAIIGLVVPGAAIMFAAGALIATGALGFWPIYWWAVVGAILGDGLSYWLGHHYRSQIRQWWPFHRHPEMLTRGETFFRHYGGKSVLLGRFVGPVRPVIPLVAGMLDMRPGKFYAINVLSAFGWAPIYLLPGMAFGASLALASAVAGRLALLVASLVIAIWLITVAIVHLYRYLSVRAEHWAIIVTQWVNKHHQFSWLLSGLLEPGKKPSRALALWVLLLIGGTWLFFAVLEDVVTLDPLVRADQAFYHFFQNLRGPLGDQLMVTLSGFGDGVVITVIIVFVTLWLVGRRSWQDLGYWLAMAAFGVLAVSALKVTLKISRPVEMYTGLDFYSFPSGHATMSVLVYGFTAVLVASELPPRWHAFPYIVATILISAIGLSRIYLGAHWLSDVAGGFALGLMWVALLAIARQRHTKHRHLGVAFAPTIAAMLLVVVPWHVSARMEDNMQRYAIHTPVQTINVESWWTNAWQHLPKHRLDLEGEYEQPLNIQWAGDPLEIRKSLLKVGWRDPLPLSLRTVLQYLVPTPTLAQLPLLPQLHNGRYESLLMVHDTENRNEKLLVLHLWTTALRLEPGETPVWIGTLAWLRLRRLPLLSFPTTGDQYNGAVALLHSDLSRFSVKSKIQPRQRQEEQYQNGIDVLLVHQE